MKTINVVLRMQNYIAHPFWPATNACIEVEKKSGVNRQRSDEKRVMALKAECVKQNITYEKYLEMKEESLRQWYQGKNDKIYIPRHQLAGGIVQTIGMAPKALRGMFDQNNFRALVQVGDFETDRKKADGVFSRFVKLETSNQRSFQKNEFIGVYLKEGKPFEAKGIIGLSDVRQSDTVQALLKTTIEQGGIGAARKMGFGRGVILEWKT